MKRSTSIAAALAVAFLFSGMTSEQAAADPCAQMRKEIQQLRHKADKKRRKWVELSSYTYVGGSQVGNAIDSARLAKGFLTGKNKGTMRELMLDAARFQAEADQLEGYMRSSANCGEGKRMANHNKRKTARMSGGYGGPEIVIGMNPRQGKGKNKNNNGGNRHKKKKKKKGGGMDSGGGCAC